VTNTVNTLESHSSVVSTTTTAQNVPLLLFIDPILNASYIASSTNLTATINPNSVENTVRIDTSTGIRGSSSREVDYNTGILDFFTESVILANPIITRNVGFFTLEEPINVITSRDGSTIEITNKSIERDSFYRAYNLGNAGHTITAFENLAFIDTGALPVSGSISSITNAYPNLTIRDFEERRFSAITLTGEMFNLAGPSINEIGATLSSNITNSDITMTISNASSLPSSGRIIINKEIIDYTSKSGNTLTGLTRGADNTIATSHTAGDYLRSF
jgi:hypothetical protein